MSRPPNVGIPSVNDRLVGDRGALAYYPKFNLKSRLKIMVSMGPLEILSQGRRWLASLACARRPCSGFLRSLGPYFQKSSSRVCNRCGYAGVRSKASHSRTPARFARAPYGHLRRASFELSRSQSVTDRLPRLQKPKSNALYMLL